MLLCQMQVGLGWVQLGWKLAAQLTILSHIKPENLLNHTIAEQA